MRATRRSEPRESRVVIARQHHMLPLRTLLASRGARFICRPNRKSNTPGSDTRVDVHSKCARSQILAERLCVEVRPPRFDTSLSTEGVVITCLLSCPPESFRPTSFGRYCEFAWGKTVIYRSNIALKAPNNTWTPLLEFDSYHFGVYNRIIEVFNWSVAVELAATKNPLLRALLTALGAH